MIYLCNYIYIHRHESFQLCFVINHDKPVQLSQSPGLSGRPGSCVAGRFVGSLSGLRPRGGGEANGTREDHQIQLECTLWLCPNSY